MTRSALGVACEERCNSIVAVEETDGVGSGRESEQIRGKSSIYWLKILS